MQLADTYYPRIISKYIPNSAQDATFNLKLQTTGINGEKLIIIANNSQ